MKLKNRMFVLIGLPVLLVIVVLVFISYDYSRRLLIEESRNTMSYQSKKFGSDLESIISEKKAYVEVSADYLLTRSQDDAQIRSDVTYLTQNVRGALQFYVGFEDGRFISGTGWIPDRGYQATSRTWYKSSKNNPEVVVSPPYLDAIQHGMVITISKQIKKDGEFQGVLGSDISLEEFENLVSNIKLEESGEAYLIDSNGNFMIHDTYEFKDNLATVENGIYSDLSKQILEKEDAFLEYEVHGVNRFYSAYKLKGTDWILVLDVPVAEVISGSQKLAGFMSILGVISIVVIMVILYLVSRSISKPIMMLSTCVEGMVDYDLTLSESSPSVIYSKNKDEVGIISRSLIQVKHTLKEIITQINDIASQLSAASEELTASSEQSADTSNDLAKIVNEISNGSMVLSDEMAHETDAMETMGRALLQNENIMNHLNDSTKAVSAANDKGKQKISQLIDATQRTKDATVLIQEAISNTNEKALQISSASDMIKSISDQTNLLALNAAIEAARAGESGKGFAVVAEEIRKLAEQSNSFTEEINQIVADLIDRTSQAVKIMDTISDVISEQNDRVNDTKMQFDLISGELDKNHVEIENLNASGNELERTKESMWHVIRSLSSLSEKNVEYVKEALSSVERQNVAAQEVAQSSASLSEMAQDMIDMMSKFKL